MNRHSIRLAKRSEIATCEWLYAEFFPEAERPGDGSAWWVAVDQDEIHGFASAKIYPGITQPPAVFLSSAGVLPEWRGQGLHKRLIRARLRWAKRQGLSRAFTYTMPSNRHSMANLAACGFVVYVPANPWFEGCAHCHHDGVVYWEKLLA